MSDAALTAALGLLRKVVPDLTQVAVTGEDGGPVRTIGEVMWKSEFLSSSTMSPDASPTRARAPPFPS